MMNVYVILVDGNLEGKTPLGIHRHM